MLIVIAILLIVGISFISIFNQLIRFRNFAKEAWSGIDVQLKVRRNLIPAIVNIVKGYAKHEKKLFEDVTKLRVRLTEQMSIKEKGEIEKGLSCALKGIFVAVENYPQLKASKNFLGLQKSLSDVEDQIQLARRYYNGTVRNYNNLVESIPSNMVASVSGFKVAEFFEIEYATERKVPDIDLEGR